MVVDELREAQGAGHSGGASADDDNVGFHLGAVDVGERVTEMDGHRDWID